MIIYGCYSYIRAHEPFTLRSFYSTLYWKSGNIGPRIKWLKKHIKKHEHWSEDFGVHFEVRKFDDMNGFD